MYRRSRRFKRKLPAYAFMLAVISFVMVFAFAQNDSASALADQNFQASVLADQDFQTQDAKPAAPAGTAQTDEWKLMLVNPWNPLPEDYTFTLKELSNGHAVDERCYPDLQKMMDACRSAGLSPVICSSFRTREMQQDLFQNKINRLMVQGLSQDAAETEAAKVVAVPGTSEHQLGLALDIVDLNNQNLDESQESTPVQKWLMEHSWEYGFILRYPNEKSEITGIIYEPWHYRYVGVDAASEIHKLGVCLEEYLT